MVTFKQKFYVWLVQVIGSLRRQAFGLAVLACAAVAYAFPSAFIEWRGVKLMSLVVPAIQIIMFGMGTTLSAADFVRVGKRPWAVAVGVFLQFLVMPFMGFLLAKGFGFSGELAAGCVLVGSVAGGTASNVVAFLAKADVALSVTMTCCSTLLSPFVTPLAMKVLAGCFVDIDAMAMMVDIMKIVIVPIVAGGIVHALLKRQFDAHKVVFDRILSFLSMTGICFTILVLTAPNDGHLLYDPCANRAEPRHLCQCRRGDRCGCGHPQHRRLSERLLADAPCGTLHAPRRGRGPHGGDRGGDAE